MVEHRNLYYLDWISFLLIFILSSLGLFLVFSATYRPTLPFSLFFKKQLFGVVVGIIIYWIFSFFDFRKFEHWAFSLFIITILLLLFTLFKGHRSLGGQRWINLGLIKFQPSEMAKIIFAPLVTVYLGMERDKKNSFFTYIPLLAILLLFVILIRKQPDLGTALLILFSGLTLLWCAGLNRAFFITCLIVGLVCAPLGWHFLLKPYQQKRILVFLGQGDTKKERYQIEQSQIAIGSGGFWGKGFLKGTQNTLHFLPEGRTDFIFAVLCEEWGFLGAFIVLLLYAFLYIRLLYLIILCKNWHGQLLATGLLLCPLFATIINIGMVTGLLPIVGIPLPFMTYGIAHLWISYVSFGIIQSIMLRRF